jgi:hypothetical protein
MNNFLNEGQKAYDFLVKNSEQVAALTTKEIETGAICFDLYRNDTGIFAVMFTAPAGSLQYQDESYFDLMIKIDSDADFVCINEYCDARNSPYWKRCNSCPDYGRFTGEMGAFLQAQEIPVDEPVIDTLRAEAKGIVTHFRPDMDACLAVWAIQRLYKFWAGDLGSLPVEFAPTGQKTEEPGKIYVDMSCGIKEVAGKCASVYLCSLLPIGHRSALEILGLLDYVQAVDTGREVVYNPIGSNLIAAWKLAGLTDMQIIDRSSEIFDGLLKLGVENIAASEIAAAGQAYTVDDASDVTGDYSILVVEQDTFPVNPAVANYTRAAIIVTRIGHNVGIKRLRENIDLNELALSGFNPTFFIHPSGFMACYGDMSGKGKQAEVECPISDRKIIESCLDILKYKK